MRPQQQHTVPGAGGVSQSTEALLNQMMKDSKLTLRQQNALREQMASKGTLPLRAHPTDGSIDGSRQHRAARSKKGIVKVPRPIKKKPQEQPPSHRPQRKPKSAIVCEREVYEPAPVTSTSYASEKERLQRSMMLNGDLSLMTKAKQIQQEKKILKSIKVDESDLDRFEEIQYEIEDRREYLEKMEELGTAKNVAPKINAEISQLVREMETIDLQRRKRDNIPDSA